MESDLQVALLDYLSTIVTERRLGLFDQVLANRTRFVRMVLDSVPDSGDVSAVMRSCECFGVQNLDLLQAPGQEFRGRRGVFVGSKKWIDFATHPHTRQGQGGASYFLDQLSADDYRLALLCHDEDATPLPELALDRKLALIVPGPDGPSQLVRDRCELRVQIKTAGFTEGFNLSVMATLCLFSLSSKLHQGPKNWGLSEDDSQLLKLSWLAQTPKRIRRITETFLAQRQLTIEDLNAALPAGLVELLLAPETEDKDQLRSLGAETEQDLLGPTRLEGPA